MVSVNKKYECLQCHKTFSAKGSYYYHKKTAHVSANREYECLSCHKTFPVKGAYYYHKKTAHVSAKYACNQCNYQATQKGNLDRHINKTHNIEILLMKQI